MSSWYQLDIRRNNWHRAIIVSSEAVVMIQRLRCSLQKAGRPVCSARSSPSCFASCQKVKKQRAQCFRKCQSKAKLRQAARSEIASTMNDPARSQQHQLPRAHHVPNSLI